MLTPAATATAAAPPAPAGAHPAAPALHGAPRTPATAALALFLLALALLPITFGGLWEPDEGRYAEIARTMILEGDWLLPSFDGRLHLGKPPFAYWMSAAGMLIFGADGFGARVLAVLCGWGVSLLALHLGTRLYDRRVGVLAALICGTSLYGFGASHFLSADVFVAFWQVAAVAAALEARRSGGLRRALFAHACWACFGLAFLTKGPPGLLAAIPLIATGRARRRAGEEPALWSIGGLSLFLVLGGWWYAVVAATVSGAGETFVVDEVLRRVFTDAHDRERTPLIYALALVVGVLPWLGALVAFGREALDRARRRRGFELPADRLLAWWVLPALAIFVLARSRQLAYVYPLFVPWAILLAAAFFRRGGRPVWHRRHAAIPLVLWCVLLALVNIGVRDQRRGGDARRLGTAIAADAGKQRDHQVINAGSREFGSAGLWSRAPHPVPHRNRHLFMSGVEGLGTLRRPGVSPVYLILHEDDVDTVLAREPGSEILARSHDLVVLRCW